MPAGVTLGYAKYRDVRRGRDATTLAVRLASGAANLLAPKECVHFVCGLCLERGHDVAVGVHRDSNLRMAELRHYDAGACTLGEKERRARMS